MQKLTWETADEITINTAKKITKIRKRKSISQQKLEVLSGVSLGSIKRFENTGQISFLSLTKIAMALGCIDEIKNLFDNIPYASIEEVINEK
ncbi:MAG: helix-turn-helix domain-containing protein [Acholeplasmatales bacterium]|nr:helix-turn-helix domain-containing protein [Acholeplasmatales bacterium]